MITLRPAEVGDTLIANSIVALDDGAVVGFCTVREDELDLLFVRSDVRGMGCAALLLAQGEELLSTRGVRRAWLACVVGNERAARFYGRHGWERAGTVRNDTEAGGEMFPVSIWRYEKDLSPGRPQQP